MIFRLTLNYFLCFFFASGYDYDASSVEKSKEFLKSCRSYLKSDTNLLWVAFQSNVLSDLCDAGDDFNVDSGKFLVEGDTGLVSIGTGGNFETSTTGKVKQKGAFMQSSTHQALTLGY